jgi:hypothetical protein
MHRAHTIKHDARCGTATVQKEKTYQFSAQDLNIDQVLNRQSTNYVQHTPMRKC